MAWEQIHVNGTQILRYVQDDRVYDVTLSGEKLTTISLQQQDQPPRTYCFNCFGHLTAARVDEIPYEGFVPPEFRLPRRFCDPLQSLPSDPTNLEFCIANLEQSI